MSLGTVIALVVFLVSLLGALGLIANPIGLILWLIGGLALAILTSGVSIPLPWHR